MLTEKMSPLAIASLTMGIITVILYPFYPLFFFLIVVLNTLLGIGAIVTGAFAIRQTTTRPLRGRTFAFVGIFTGANGLLWIWINFIFRQTS